MPDPKTTVTVDKAEFEELLRQNGENAALIEQMAAKLDRLESAQLAGVGIDPAIAARAHLPRTMVQFNEHYTRAAIPSTVQDGALIHEGYSVAQNEIVNLRDDEVKRLNRDRPGLIESDQKKWQPKIAVSVQPGHDDHGRFGYKIVRTPVPVEQLIKIAQDIG